MKTAIAGALLLLLVAVGCDDAADPQPIESYAGAFVTTLGMDTVAVESFQRAEDGMTAEVVLRTPTTRMVSYDLQLDSAGQMISYELVERHPPSDSVLRSETYLPDGDSIRVEVTEDGSTLRHWIPYQEGMLPFVDMVHWPFEIVLTRAYVAEADSQVQVLFTERGTLDFVVEREAEGQMSITHPFRGTMDVRIDERGRLVELDAARTTRKLVVQRAADLDLSTIAARFAEEDDAGRSFGPLSGRGELNASVDGANVMVDYGVPEKRGRAIFGDLVPWGRLWRTGANRATHFQTDQSLRFGQVILPAGRYTLYTIPEEDGGTLIINTQTGQGGTTYDDTLDFGRVPMTRTTLDSTVEALQFDLEDTDEGGTLKMRWDDSEFSVPFQVDSSMQ